MSSSKQRKGEGRRGRKRGGGEGEAMHNDIFFCKL